MNKKQGFTLIEIMIAVAIVAILAAIAYPSYLQHVQSARREEAKRTLFLVAQNMENYYALNMTYVVSGATGLPSNAPTDVSIDGHNYYALSVSSATQTDYQLVATPTAGSAQVSDSCGTLRLNRDGSTSATLASCW
jgi:type IV pilus assembly protein PilE